MATKSPDGEDSDQMMGVTGDSPTPVLNLIVHRFHSDKSDKRQYLQLVFFPRLVLDLDLLEKHVSRRQDGICQF